MQALKAAIERRDPGHPINNLPPRPPAAYMSAADITSIARGDETRPADFKSRRSGATVVSRGRWLHRRDSPCSTLAASRDPVSASTRSRSPPSTHPYDMASEADFLNVLALDRRCGGPRPGRERSRGHSDPVKRRYDSTLRSTRTLATWERRRLAAAELPGHRQPCR